MFSQRKRFYERKTFYGFILALLLAFGFWINQDPGTQGEGDLKEPVVNTGEQLPASGQKEPAVASGQPDLTYGLDDADSGFDGDLSADLGDDPDENSDLTAAGSDISGGNPEVDGPCYVVKEDQGFIRIYSVDASGEYELVRTTNISFSLLSESDQRLFRQGVVKQTEDDLSDLLQDFES